MKSDLNNVTFVGKSCFRAMCPGDNRPEGGACLLLRASIRTPMQEECVSAGHNFNKSSCNASGSNVFRLRGTEAYLNPNFSPSDHGRVVDLRPVLGGFDTLILLETNDY